MLLALLVFMGEGFSIIPWQLRSSIMNHMSFFSKGNVHNSRNHCGILWILKSKLWTEPQCRNIQNSPQWLTTGMSLKNAPSSKIDRLQMTFQLIPIILDIRFLIYCISMPCIFFLSCFSSSFGLATNQKQKKKKTKFLFVTNLHNAPLCFVVVVACWQIGKEFEFVQGAPQFPERKRAHETISVDVAADGRQGWWHNGS